jgi:nucleoside-diphosphate-sugar epimerase
VPAHALSGVPVLVVGGSGFIGGRLAERLVVQCGARVRVLARRPMSVAGLARFPVEIATGDLLDPDRVRAAAHGCRVIFNCSKGKGGDAAVRMAVDLDGVKNVIEVAALTRARVVHISTMAVYDRPQFGSFDEQTGPVSPGDSYSDNKRAGEQQALMLGAQSDVPVVVVQPSVVYGPHAGVYGTEILQELKTHRLILINGGSGICNAVYVDDVVTAILLAATVEQAVGQRFLISGSEYPSWREFFGAFERMLGVEGTVAMSEGEALALWTRSRRRAWLLPEMVRAVMSDRVLRRRLMATKEGVLIRSMASRIVSDETRQRLRGSDAPAVPVSDTRPVAAVRPWVVENMARKAQVDITKARRLLGYEPAFNLDRGMHLTRLWARWAGLIP